MGGELKKSKSAAELHGAPTSPSAAAAAAAAAAQQFISAGYLGSVYF